MNTTTTTGDLVHYLCLTHCLLDPSHGALCRPPWLQDCLRCAMLLV